MCIKNRVKPSPPTSWFWKSSDFDNLIDKSDLAESADFQKQDGGHGPTLFFMYTAGN